MDSLRYIEVIGSALVTRPIEAYRGTVTITVTTRKTKAGLDHSLHLRNQVISALKSAGIADEHIEEAGGSIDHSSWSAKKRLSHELRIKHEDMQVFANAMVAVEQMFSSLME